MIIPETTREKLSKEYLRVSQERVSKAEALTMGIVFQILIAAVFGFAINALLYQFCAVAVLGWTGWLIGKTVRQDAKVNEIIEKASKKGLHWNEDRQEFTHA